MITSVRARGIADGLAELTQRAAPFLKQHTAGVVLFFTTWAAVIYYGWDINSWKFAFVGDEWQFYSAARAIADKNLLVNPFDIHGVYGFNSVLGSVYQALFIKLLGATNAAWRFSNIILIVPISIFFYLWMRDRFDQRTALISTLILQASSFVASYLKIGYVNAQAFALFIVALYLAGRCGKQLTLRNAGWLGAILGVSFYIYIGPLFPLLMAPYLLPLVFERRRYTREELLKAGALCLALYLAIALPGILSSLGENSPASKTIFAREYTDNTQTAINVFHDFLLFYQNFDYFYNHFIAGPYLDLYSRIFAAAGTLIALVALVRFRSEKYLYLLLAYVLLAVVIGVTTPYAYAATTRGIFFIPFGAAFAGIALAGVTRWLSVPRLAYALVAVIWIANIYQSQVGVFQTTGYPATGLLIKSLQDAQRQGQHRVVLVLSANHPYRNAGYVEAPIIQQAYGLQDEQLSVLDPTQVRCTMLRGSRVVLFEDDDSAVNALARLSCPTDTTYTVDTLAPAYLL
jgi:dolichyl-phosphate-mannose-protein mannosyltransferase